MGIKKGKLESFSMGHAKIIESMRKSCALVSRGTTEKRVIRAVFSQLSLEELNSCVKVLLCFMMR